MSNKPIDNHGNPFTSYFTTLSAVSLSNTTTVANHTAIFVGGAGNLAVQMAAGGSEVVLTLPAGAWLPIQVYCINQANTTATNIVIAG